MVLLLGFAALVVDWGLGTTERRAAQNAADAAALGGAVEFTTTSATDAVAAAVTEVYAKIAANDIVISAGDWAACTDPDALARRTLTDLGVAGGSDCISFSEAYTEIRVRIPTIDVPAVFGVFVGSNGLEVSAFAQAQVRPSFGGAFAFPSGAFSAAGGTEICLKTGTGSTNVESCDNPSTGDFGTFNAYFYSGPNECTSGGQPGPRSRIIALGMDHQLGLHPSGAGGGLVNGASCPQFGGPAKPNMVDSSGGYSNTDITDGIVKGGTWGGAFKGRLNGGTVATGTYGSATIFGKGIDNRALWTYIDTSVASPNCVAAAGHPAQPATPALYATAWADMLTCLKTTNSVIFLPSIADSPRLSVVPKYWELAKLANNSCCYHVELLVPMWIEGIYMKDSVNCTGNLRVAGGVCVHEPGMVGTTTVVPQGQQKLDSLGAVIIGCTQLVEPVCTKLTGGGGTPTFGVVELTK